MNNEERAAMDERRAGCLRHDRVNPSSPIDECSPPERLLLTAGEAAAMLCVSERHFRALYASGRVPRAVHLGRSTRWRRKELVAWTDAGCPPRDKWSFM